METLSEVLEKLTLSETLKLSLKETASIDSLDSCCRRMSSWVSTLHASDPENAAGPFLFQILTSTHHAVALAAAGFYAPSAGSIRAAFESALYFIYFRNHRAELNTLIRDTSYFIDKALVLEYLAKHCPDYVTKQAAVGLNGRMGTWYKHTSALVHAQQPGTFTKSSDLLSITFDTAHFKSIANVIAQGTEIINSLFLVTIATEVWGETSKTNRIAFLSGLSADAKKALKLDIVGTK